MPQYVLKQTQSLPEHKIYVLETNYYGDKYVVQRKQLEKNTLFYAAHGDQTKIPELVNAIKPDIIHIQELPESFLDESTLNFIYKQDRTWFILVTTHSSLTKGSDFKRVPDRIVAVNNWQKQKFINEIPGIDVDVWEYPIEDLKPTQEERQIAQGILEHFSFHEKGKHILNVGLFTPGKNQGELFEIARKNPENHYHFVGNQADNFKPYWEPLMKNRPDNCYVWGERDDVDNFYKACDEMYFSSLFELNPLCVKEALSYGLPIKMRKLHTYGTDYDKNPLITFI